VSHEKKEKEKTRTVLPAKGGKKGVAKREGEDERIPLKGGGKRRLPAHQKKTKGKKRGGVRPLSFPLF